MAGALQDPVAPALGARPEALERRPLIHPGPAHHERARVDRPDLAGIGDGAGQHLADGVACRLRREGQRSLRLLGGHPADQVHHSAGLPRRDADVARLRPSFHGSFLAFRLASAAPVVPHVAAERTGGRELAELVSDHRFGDEHRHVLTAVVHGDRVAEHRRDDHRAARPRLDDVLSALVVLHVHLLHQVVVDKWALLQATRHRQVLLPLLLAAPTGDQLVAGLVRLAGPALGLTPRADRMPATGGLALAATERVVNRVHRHAADGGPTALPPAAARLAELDVALLGVADLADGSPAAHVDPPELAGGHAQLRVLALLGQQLYSRAGRPGDLGAATGPQLDRVHHGAGRDVAQREAVAGLDVRARAVLHQVALLHALRGEDVALLPVGVVQQRDPGGPVRVVLDVRDLGRHAVLVRPAEVDQPVRALVPAALVPGGDPAVHVPAAGAVQRAHQGLLRLTTRDLGEVGAARPSSAGGRRLVLADSHVLKLLCIARLADRTAEDVDPLASGEADDGALGVRPLAPAELRPAALAWPVERVHAGHPDVEDGLNGLPDLRLVRAGRDDEGVLAVVGQPVALLGDDRPDQDVPGVGGLVHA